MVGGNPGYISSYGETLAREFDKAGYSVRVVSTSPNRYLRPLDILHKLHLWRHQIDIVLVDVYSGWSFVVTDLATRFACRLKRPLVLALHGGALPQHFLRFPQWAKRVLSRADQIVVPSPYLGRALETLQLSARIIPNLINLTEYPFRHREKVRPNLLWMRTFHPVRNPELALRSIARLKRKYPEITLCMAGQDQGSLSQIRRMAIELGIDDSVRFPGFINREQKIEEASKADIFVNTNRVDNMPVSVLEACAFGLPVISTDVGGIRELLKHEDNALLIADDDDEAMADAIERLLEDPNLSSLLSSNGRKLAESVSWETIRLDWEKLFAELLAKNGNSHAK
jgi:glycosyltransferase involved in cell wall biosynthesis